MQLGTSPLIQDYSLCQQVVTIYHREESSVTRAVHYGVYFNYEETQEVDERGSSEKNTFLLVIPVSGGDAPCSVGDKVLLGVGEAVPDDAMAFWRELIPTKRQNLVVVRKVSPKWWAGEIVHYEIRG